MGLMDDYPLERFWRDARVERIWDGTSLRFSGISSAAISFVRLRALTRMKPLGRVLRTLRSIAVIGGGTWCAERD